MPNTALSGSTDYVHETGWYASIYVQEVKGRIQDFKIEGAQKMSSPYHERKAQNP